MNTFVAPGQSTKLDVLPPYTASLDVQHPHQGSVIKHTSEVDSAVGFSIRTGVLAAVVAFVAVVVVLWFDADIFSLIALSAFVGAFCVVFVVAWGLDTLKAPEFGALVGAVFQWVVIMREQKERWAHYKWQAGRTLPARPWWVEYKGWIVLGGLTWSTFGLVVIAFVLWG